MKGGVLNSRSISFLFLFILSIVIVSCEDYEDESKQSTGGNIDEVVVIVNDQNLKTAFSDTIAYYLMPLFGGLPQPEPKFDVRIKSYSQFEASELLQKYRNIIFIAALDEKTPVSELIKKNLGEENYKKAYGENVSFFAVQRDIFAKPQLVMYVFAPSEKEIIDRLDLYHEKIFNVLRKSENQKIATSLYYSGTNKSASEILQRKFNINMKIPRQYTVINEDSTFVRIIKEQYYRDQQDNIVKEIKQNIVIKSFPFEYTQALRDIRDESLDTLDINPLPLILRDSVMNEYIKGSSDEYWPYVDKKQLIYQKELSFDGKKAIETRGLWRLDRPWMGGPYINYIFVDEPNGRILFIDGFVYAAGSKKRRLVRELETIIETIDFLNSN